MRKHPFLFMGDAMKNYLLSLCMFGMLSCNAMQWWSFSLKKDCKSICQKKNECTLVQLYFLGNGCFDQQAYDACVKKCLAQKELDRKKMVSKK